jgi:hypothetical protein
VDASKSSTYEHCSRSGETPRKLKMEQGFREKLQNFEFKILKTQEIPGHRHCIFGSVKIKNSQKIKFSMHYQSMTKYLFVIFAELKIQKKNLPKIYTMFEIF